MSDATNSAYNCPTETLIVTMLIRLPLNFAGVISWSIVTLQGEKNPTAYSTEMNYP